MSPFQKAKIAAAAKCHELAAAERAELDRLLRRVHDHAQLASLRRGAERLEAAAVAIMALDENAERVPS